MEKKVLSDNEIYVGKITGTTIPRDFIRVKIFESFVLKKRISQNPKIAAFDDYQVPGGAPFQWVQDYIHSHFKLIKRRTLVPLSTWGNIYAPLEQSYNRHHIPPRQNRITPPTYTWIYGVEVQPKSCHLIIEYNDKEKEENTQHIPLENNKFIIFPSYLRYFISKNKSCESNLFLSVNCELV